MRTIHRTDAAVCTTQNDWCCVLWRIRERTLWILCLVGGVLGAWIVFFGMRHKTQHQSFWVVQSAASVLWVVLIVAVVTR